jgi:methyl-accepting chemotaxis protein
MTSSQLVKVLLVTVLPFFIITLFCLAIWNYFDARANAEIYAEEILKQIAANSVSYIDGNLFSQISAPEDYNSDAYQSLASILEKVERTNNLGHANVRTLRRKDNITSYVVTSDKRNMIGHEFDLWLEMNPVFNKGKIEIKAPYDNNKGIYMSAFGPIHNASGEVVGLLQIDKDISDIYPDILSFLYLPAGLAVLAILGIVVLIPLRLKPLQKSVDSITDHLKNIGAGKTAGQYKNTDNIYLNEIVETLGKLQGTVSKQVQTEEDKDKLHKQIKELLRIVSAAADGDFTITAHVTADTLGALSDSFNLMVSDLSDLIRDVKKSADQISEFTTGILDTTTDMASGAENQAREIEHTRNLAQNVRSLSNNTNSSALRASESAKTAKDVAERGGEVVIESIEAMHRIKEAVLDTSRQIKQLGTNSERISEITDFISDIAKRTNLLALNATIEAAKAGEAGRGFTVVADEVRNLAERSSRAASDITKLIEDIQGRTSEVIKAMEVGNNEVVSGTKMVDEAGSALKEIIGTVDISSSSVEEISEATEKQLKSAEDIAEVIEKIAKIAQQTAEGAKNSEVEIKRLNSLSDSLNSAVAKFKLSQ